jgi:hypothetical protein
VRIKFVKQLDDFGCVPACIAMITGQAYADVAKYFGNDFSRKGIGIDAALKYLADQGLDILSKHIDFYNHKDFGRDEMFRPFADAHILIVQQFVDSKQTHALVMTKSGKLLCPGGATPEAIKASYVVTDSIGVFESRSFTRT